MRSRVQGYLAGFDDEWEDHLTRCILGAQNALEEKDALPCFPEAMVAPPEATTPAPESDPFLRSEERSLSRVALLRVPQRAIGPGGTGMPRQRDNREPPGQGQEPPLQHRGRKRLPLAAIEGRLGRKG